MLCETQGVAEKDKIDGMTMGWSGAEARGLKGQTFDWKKSGDFEAPEKKMAAYIK
jgi:hypothetical protein